jgi:hypothetical protein
VALDPVPASQASTGNWKVIYIPSGNALSVAVLVGGTAKPLTYGFTPDGFNWGITEASVPDPRLTLSVTLSQPGSSTDTLEVKYVDSTDATSAAMILTQGVAGILNVRRGIANATIPTVGQVADTITFVAGRQRPDAPTANGLDTISQTLYITAVPVRKGTLVA